MSREKDTLKEKAKGAFRVAKTNKLIEAIILIALGLVLFIWSGTALDIICRAIAVIIAIIGIVVVIMYFFGRNNVYGSAVGLFFGVVSIALGCYLFSYPKILESLGPVIVGMIILVTGIVDLSEAMRITRQKSGGAIAALIIAVIEIILGVVFILHPSILNGIIMKLMAISLIADGIADIWVMFQIGRSEKVVSNVAEAVADAAAGNYVDGQTRPLNEAEDSAGVNTEKAEDSKGFFARQKEKTEARKKAKEEEKAAEEEVKEAAPGPESASESAVSSSGGYTTIPRHHDNSSGTAEASSAASEPAESAAKTEPETNPGN